MREKLKVLDLFSGIGGFSLGLERTGGFETIAFCEIENYCQRVLKKHWPEVYIHSDIRTLTAKHFDGRKRPDVLCGGFPCQDISNAGKRAGIGGERSGLWGEYARLIRELRPKYVIVENVAALVRMGLGRVLGDLAASGYDAEWDCLPASAFGAPHRRDRIWIVAYPMQRGGSTEPRQQQGERAEVIDSGSAGDVACPQGQQDRRVFERRLQANAGANGEAGDVAYAESERCREAREYSERPTQRITGSGEVLAHAHIGGPRQFGCEWPAEPQVGRVVDGLPNRAHQLRGLGNAVVPKIPEWIGQRILSAEAHNE